MFLQACLGCFQLLGQPGVPCLCRGGKMRRCFSCFGRNGGWNLAVSPSLGRSAANVLNVLTISQQSFAEFLNSVWLLMPGGINGITTCLAAHESFTLGTVLQFLSLN